VCGLNGLDNALELSALDEGQDDDKEFMDALDWLMETELQLVDDDPQGRTPAHRWGPDGRDFGIALQLQGDPEGRTHVKVSGDPARAAQRFWRIALSERGRVHRQEDGAAVIAPGLVVIFGDGSWDTLGDYTPEADERSFWHQVGACYAELPPWLLL
jgi:hypothetical protein